MKTLRLALLMAFCAAAAAASDVVVLRGGTRIDLKQPPVKQGNNILMTRKDGTLLSVPASEIDAKATAAARAAAAAPAKAPAAAPAPETPAQAARATRGAPAARVKVTDADVGHYLEPGGPEGEEKQESSQGGTGARVDIADYTQSKSGDNLIVKGTLRNLGTAAALSTRLTVTPIDEKGQAIDSTEASISNGTIEPGRSVNFSATIPVGSRVVGTMRFSPRWVSQAPPAEAAPASGAPASTPGGSPAPATRAAAARPPAPVPTPFGNGTLYAAPAAAASTERPADGKNGYIPGAAIPENQPKPPE